MISIIILLAWALAGIIFHGPILRAVQRDMKGCDDPGCQLRHDLAEIERRYPGAVNAAAKVWAAFLAVAWPAGLLLIIATRRGSKP